MTQVTIAGMTGMPIEFTEKQKALIARIIEAENQLPDTGYLIPEGFVIRLIEQRGEKPGGRGQVGDAI